MRFLTKDRALALALLLLVAIFFLETRNIPARTSWQPYGSAFYPRILLAVMGGLALILFVHSFLQGRTDQPPLLPDVRDFFARQYRIVLLFVLFGLYTALLPVLGFNIATMAYLILSFGPLMGFNKRRKLVLALAVAVGATLLVYVVFQHGLRIRLP
jgi:putative tricarboxylic transport membrane protein